MNLEQKIAYDNSIVVKQTRSLDRGVDIPQSDGAKALLLDEAFTTGIPGSWTQIVYSGTGIWQWSGTIGGSYGVPPNSDGLYATADSDANSSWVYDVGLFTPSMDMTGGIVVTIDLDRNFQDIGNNDIAAVRVYSGGTAPGNLEVTLWQQSFDDPYAGVHASYLIDATVYADPSDVYLEFYYSTAGGTYQWNFAIDNVYIYLVEPPGDLYGYVFNGGGLTIANATVGIPALGMFTTTGPDGYYEMFGVDAGNQEVSASKAGYNTITHTVPIPSGGIIQQDFILTAPTMIISPTSHTYTLNPEEYFTTATGILNTGDGPLTWTAEVVYPVTDGPSSTVHIPAFTGTIPNSGQATSIHAAPNTPGGQGQPGSLDGILGDGFGWLGCPGDDNLYMMDMITYGTTLIGGSVVDPASGDFLNNDADVMYVGGGWGATLYSIDVATGAGTLIGGFSGAPYAISGMATDRTSGDVYVCGTNVSASYIGTLDVATGVITTIGGSITNAPGLIDIAINGAGVMYGWCIVNDATYTIDKTTGVATLLGSLGFNANFGQGGNYNPADGEIYLSAYNSAAGPELRVMDQLTGATSYLAGLPGGQAAAFGFPGGGGVGSWLTLDYYTNIVPPMGGLDNVPTNFDAQGTLPGEVYTADLVFYSQDPDVGTITIPCTMIIAGDPMVPPTDLTVDLIDSLLGTVELNWVWTTDLTFQFFIVKRDGVPVGTSTTTTYQEDLPDYGTYCYTVQTFYDEGTSVPSDEACVDWDMPVVFVDPDFHEGWVWVDNEYMWQTTINNLGIGTLAYTIPPVGGCDHEVVMYDDYGDGWNGGTLTVYVDGDIALDAITMSGSGPSYEYFLAANGQTITSSFSCGGWCYECSYYIYDGFGALVFSDGVGGVDPTGGAGPAACPGFIIDVTPDAGFVPAGGSDDVVVTWSALGFAPGDYTQDFYVESNDPVTPSVTVGNLMHVYEPGQFAGNVTDCESGLPVSGVTVTADIWQTITDANGDYSLYVDEDSYDVYFDKLSYDGYIAVDTFALAGVVTPLDVVLCEAPYPVPWVLATVNYPDEDFCDVEWSLPEGPYEIIYDDGEAEDLFAWNTAGNENAVRFTPLGYPANVIGGRLFVGDGSFPAGSWLGTEFVIMVYDDDGAGGLPGAMLDSIPVMVNNYGWVEFYGLDITLDDGDFYLSMLQLNPSPNTAPIGIDASLPNVYRSYSRTTITPDWSLSVYQDFMMRAYVEGPQTDVLTDSETMVYPAKVNREKASEYFSTANNSPFVGAGTVKAGRTGNIEGYVDNSDAVLYYVVARMSDFDPVLGPATGTMTVLNNVTDVFYQDADFGALPMGWYAYAVQVAYSTGGMSPWTYSNIVGRDMDAAVTFEITLCDGNVPEDVEITMTGLDFPYIVYEGFTDATGIYTFDQVWKGTYNIELDKIGYQTYQWDALISEDVTIVVLMSEKMYKARNLWVDPLTSFAYWDPPVVIALEEDFEGFTFPPDGWTASSNGVGWFSTGNGSSASWTIPAWSSNYACSNDDGAGPGNDGSVDYLITPPLDLREVDSYRLMFDSYYDVYWGLQIATVEYSYDAGANWDVYYALTPNPGSWDYIDIDLASFSGLTATTPVWFAFHSDDGGGWSSGWAIDNVMFANGEIEPVAYHVYLDGALDGVTDTTFYQYAYLTYGVTYTASVAAQYSCGLSDEIYYTFTSGFLLPPRNLDGLTFDNTVHVWWEPPVEPVTDFIPPFTGQLAPSDFAPSSKEAPATPPGVSTEIPIVLDGVLADFGYYGAPSDDQLYEMDMLTYGQTIIGPSATDPAGGDFMNGDYTNFYVGSTWGATLSVVDVTTGGSTTIGAFSGSPTGDISGMACDRTTNTMYVCGTNISFSYIGTLDIGTGAITQIGGNITVAPGMIDIAIDATGQMYGWCLVTDAAYLIDKTTGVVTLLGSLGIDINFGQGGNYDYDAGFIYLTAYNAAAGPEFRVMDPGTGATTLLAPLSAAQAAAFGVPSDGPGGGGGGNVPENLLGYNLYRDFNNIAYIPYTEEDTTHYFDYELQPLCYEYDVTAVYDLTPYGFPGETAESMYEGPFDVCVEYGWPLAFVEDWNTGSFDPNLWNHGDNWVVNGQFGNPLPCAEFTWDPVLNDYKSALTSYPIDGKYHPQTTDPYIDGRIFFDFDISLVDNGSSGDEIINVEVWDDGNWFNVATFSNADGNFGWTSYHFEISDHAFGKIFKVRFQAEGVNSSGIISWFVDNIHLYRECDAPTDLTADGIDTRSIELNWTPPATGGGTGGGEWITWDDGVHFGGVGLTAGGVFSVASRWDVDDISMYDGQYITKIRFVPYLNAVTTTFTLNVWEGTDATLVYEQALGSVILGEWNEVTLTTPVPVNATEELWFGYTVDSPEGENPAGRDEGPAVAGYGDMIYLNGAWEALSLISTIDGNWNLQAFIGDMDDDAVTPLPAITGTPAYTSGTPVAVEATNKVSVDSDVSTRALTGYNVYWNDFGAGYNFLEFTEDTTYLHEVETPYEIGSLQCYYVTAVFEDCEPESNEACVIATGIEDPAIADGISVYPNPARDILNITSSADITHVTVMNYVGQVVYNQKVVEDNDLQLNVAGYETGVYMVKVETTAGILIKKVTIIH